MALWQKRTENLVRPAKLKVIAQNTRSPF